MTKLAYFLITLLLACNTIAAELRGTGDLGLIIERAKGAALIVDTTQRKILAEVEGLGDLSHASAVFSRDQRYAYVFGRDGGLSKIDLLTASIAKRIVQAGNSIGGAISQDGKIIAVSNYTPGGARLFDAATLEPLAEIPATYGEDKSSKTVGIADAPGQRFVYSLFEAGEIWLIDAHNPREPKIQKFTGIGQQPYDGVLTGQGRYYLAGLFGEPGLTVLDLWNQKTRRILEDYGQGEEKLPVYKMPHLQGWSFSDDYALAPGVGRHEVLALDRRTWERAKTISVAGQPVFVIASPDGRTAWVNFALPDNHKVQVIDLATLEVIKTLEPGKAVLHLEFTPRGEEVWVSARDEDKIVIYNTETYEPIATLPADKPSGIFFTARAHRIGL
jgi:protein NirF